MESGTQRAWYMGVDASVPYQSWCHTGRVAFHGPVLHVSMGLCPFLLCFVFIFLPWFPLFVYNYIYIWWRAPLKKIRRVWLAFVKIPMSNALDWFCCISYACSNRSCLHHVFYTFIQSVIYVSMPPTIP